MTRWKATSLHLIASLLLAIPMALLVYFVWFPQPWFVVAGGATLLLVLVGVNLAIGPLLTSIVFDPNKRRIALRMDLAFVILVQVAAFSYGVYIITNARPVFIVAAVDRYVIVAANQLDDKDLALGSAAQFRSRSWSGPRLIGALPGDGTHQPQRLFEVLGGGKDIDRLPRYYVPWAQVGRGVLEHAKSLVDLRSTDPAEQAHIRALQEDAVRRGRILAWLPLQRQENNYTVVIDRKTGKPLAVLDIDPWPSAEQ